MEAIKANIAFIEISGEVPALKPLGDSVIELNDLELALVGGGTADVAF